MNTEKNIVRFIYYTLHTYFLALGFLAFISFSYPLIHSKTVLITKDFSNVTDSVLRTNCRNLLLSFLALSAIVAAVRIAIYFSHQRNVSKELKSIESKFLGTAKLVSENAGTTKSVEDEINSNEVEKKIIELNEVEKEEEVEK